MIEARNLNEASAEVCKLLLTEGVKRKTRGFDCVEYPAPLVIKISEPYDRFMTIEGRKNNKMLPFVESMWLLNGINEISVPSGFVKNLLNFSDDGVTMRAGYGPRIRGFNGGHQDYYYAFPISQIPYAIDQFRFCYDTLKKDKNSRQALITIHDPNKDCYENGHLKITKDQPCTRSLHFMTNIEGKLDIIVHMRSNDVVWGFSAVNVTNFSIFQWIMADLLGMEVGNYYHIADNMHYYEDPKLKRLVERMSKYFYVDPIRIWNDYEKKEISYNEFLRNISEIWNFLVHIANERKPKGFFREIRDEDPEFRMEELNGVFRDIANVLAYEFYGGERILAEIKNPHMRSAIQ